MNNSFDFYGRAKVNDWLNDRKIKSGCTKHNITYLREFNDLYSQLSETLCYLYFLSVHLNNKYAKYMLGSGMKQKKFVVLVRIKLKERQVPTAYVDAFERDVKTIRDRINRIQALAFDNLRLTKYYPFFSQTGFHDLYNSVTVYNKDDRMAAEKALAQKCFEWTEAHSDEVDAYMESIKDELEALKAHEDKIKTQQKAEKEAARKEEAEKKAFEKECQKNREERMKRERRIQKEIDNNARISYYG